jgi:putative ABC transport system permease protein
VVISYTTWQRLFAGDPQAIGDRIVINAHPMTVIGVTPPSFKGFYVDAGFGFSVPLSVLNRYLGTDAKRPLRGLQAVGRLRKGVSIAEAEAAVTASWSSLRVDAIPAQLPATERRDIAASGIKVRSLASGFSTLRTRFARPLGVLLAATVLLLVIGCVNISGLLLARTAARDHQFAILLALGAPRARFIQQVLIEGIVLSLLGTALALPFAWKGTVAVTNAMWSGRDPIALSTSPDSLVLAATIVVSIVTGLLMSALPAVRAARRRHLGLRTQRAVTDSLGFWGRGLLVAQIALSLLLLVGAGLFARTLWNLRHIDAGFDNPNVRWARLFALPGTPPPKDFRAHYTSLLRQIEELPQVESVAMSSMFPTYFNASQFLTRYSVDSRATGNAVGNALMETITPRFFETVGIPRKQGRDFSWSDTVGSPAVAILSESLSLRLFGNSTPIGQLVRIGTDPKRASVEIVGVVGDASIGDLRDPHVPVVYLSRLQETMQTPVLLFRPVAGASSPDSAIQSVIGSNNYDYPRGWYSIAQNVDATLVQERMLAALSAFLAAISLVLAFVGVHGLMSFSVAQRTRELGIRLALGATPSRLRYIFVREGLLLSVAGVAIGLLATVAVSRVAASMLFRVSPSDPWVLLSASAFFIAISLSAVIRPAIRAASLDPVETLRAE